MKMRNLLVFGLALVIPALPALADDFLPPTWRGADRTVMAEWGFGTALSPAPADDFVSVPSGLVAPNATITPAQGASWMQTWGGRTGVWPLSGEIEIPFPNFTDGDRKDVYIQLTWWEAICGPGPTVTIQVPDKLPVTATLLFSDNLGEGWYHSIYAGTIIPNPEMEIIRISGDIYMDQVVIDTICPEPGTMFLLGLAALGTLIRRRRKA